MTEAQLNVAFDRIEDFLSVNSRTPSMDAVLCLQEAVGIGAKERVVIRERVQRLREVHAQRSEQTGGLLLGLILAGLREGLEGTATE